MEFFFILKVLFATQKMMADVNNSLIFQEYLLLQVATTLSFSLQPWLQD
jgi:hypothetical protein